MSAELESDIQKIKIHTDSGIFNFYVLYDSIIKVEENRELNVMEFIFNDEINGEYYDYQIDTAIETFEHARDYFSLRAHILIINNSRLIFDYKPLDDNLIDTVEVIPISSERLIIFGDTIKRIKSSNEL